MHSPITTAAPALRPARSLTGRLARLLLAAGLVTALAGGLTFGAAGLGSLYGAGEGIPFWGGQGFMWETHIARASVIVIFPLWVSTTVDASSPLDNASSILSIQTLPSSSAFFPSSFG